VPWWSYAVWVVTAVLSGLLLATFVRRAPVEPAPSEVEIGSAQ